MKLKMEYRLWLAILCLFPFESQSKELIKGRVTFVDQCSGEPSSFTTPNGTTLRLDLFDLNITQSLHIHVHYQLAGAPGDTARQHAYDYEYNYDPGEFDQNLKFFFKTPREHALNSVEKLIPGSHIWQASVTWDQGTGFGQGVDTLYRATGTPTLYKMNSDVVCHWTSSPGISSHYYFNADQQKMTVQRAVRDLSQISLNHEPDAMNPLTTPQSIYGVSGFYFSNRDQESYLNQNMMLNRSWTLYENQGGIFADHFYFSRIRVDRLEWTPSDNGCRHYQKVESGTLDVGTPVSEFYSAPQSLSGDPKGMLNFLQSYLPNLDTCSSQGLSPPSSIPDGTSFQNEALIFNSDTQNPQ
jgi:hypothetical protein